MNSEWKLPDLGENVESATVLKVLIAAGDTVAKEQPILEVETDKVNLEVPSTIEGKVEKIHVSEGDIVSVGQVILTMEGDAASAEARQVAVGQSTPAPAAKTPTPEAKPAAAPAQAPAPTAAPAPSKVTPIRQAVATSGVRAAPAVRHLARELGLHLEEIPGSGPDGQVLMLDVKQFASNVIAQVRGGATSSGVAAVKLPDFSKWGPVDTEAMTQVRRKTAERMTQAWTTIPHVTHFDNADVTELEKLRKQWGKEVEKAGAKLTVTAMLIKIVAEALKQFPKFAASIDMAHEQIIYKKYCHIGVAVDTEQGLLVPVVHNADQKSLLEIAKELKDLSTRAREKKLTLEDVQGSVFTITNLGGIGGTAFTPIINPPEVAILAVSRGKAGQLPLGLSYDHRLIDGADAARFMQFVVEQVEKPHELTLK